MFKTTDLFKIFEISKDSTEREVKKAFYRLCQKYHPDKVAETERESATKHFQVVSAICELLVDPKRREIYVKSGEILDGSEALSDDFDWEAYVAQFKRVTADEIGAFSSCYKDSEEERADLRAAYKRFEGDLDRIMENVPLAEVLDDEERFRTILTEMVSRGELPAFDAFAKEPESKRKKRREKALRERRRFAKAEAKQKESQKSDTGAKSSVADEQSLVALIQSRNRSCFDGGFLDSLAQKYAKQPQRRTKSAKNASKKRLTSSSEDSESEEEDSPPQSSRKSLSKQKKVADSDDEEEQHMCSGDRAAASAKSRAKTQTVADKRKKLKR